MSALPYFARRLSLERNRVGLSKTDLARKVGVTSTMITYLETGKRGPSWHLVQLLCLALELSPETFQDDSLALPTIEPVRGRGRPRKESVDLPATKRPRGRPRKPASDRPARKG